MTTIQAINPATGEVSAEYSEDSSESVAAKVTRARAAQKLWAKRPLQERKEILLKFRDLVARDLEVLAATLTQDMGKPLAQSRNELNALARRINFFLENTQNVIADEVVHSESGLEERIAHEPLGVVANVSAWNYPYFVGANVYVPALLTGNAVVYKPSEFALGTGKHVERLLHEAGVPSDVFSTVIGGGQVGAWLVDQPVDGVFFTGSYATGKKIAQAVAGRMIPLQLELGGKDPVYVADDVDIKSVADGVSDGAFYNNGQSCCAVERIYVHEAIYDSFVEAFVECVRGFKMGDPTQAGTYLGPLTRSAQIAVLEDQIKDAVDRGAVVKTGGKRVEGKGYYFEPTTLVNVDHSMKVMRDESFGPIIGIMKVRDDHDAIAKMNDTEYGLTAGVYTRSKERAQAILSELNAGSAYWNCCDRVSPALPWSGRGHSGIGLTLSTHGIRVFTRPKAYHLRG